MPKHFKYITTPIYYASGNPHIGTAYTTIAADVLARYWRGRGDKVFFLTGTDEHGAKIAQAAECAGKSPSEFVGEQAQKYVDVWKKLDIDYSQFFRTTDPKHEKIVQELSTKLKDQKLIEKRQYSGLYCVGCERYLSEEELVDGKCPDHKTKPVSQSEENYFFLLSKYRDKLIKAIEDGELNILPETRRNEVLGKLRQGLDDVSISRSSVKWGIPFPGDESQTIYVWFDALLNYYSATHIYDTLPWEDHPADIHIVGKDILWFHAIIWPAMLMALHLPLPKLIFAHGFFTVDGEKMSKSRGNVLDPVALSKKFGAEPLRYALLREFPFGSDGDFSEATLKKRYDRDLANELGNLLQRVLVMITKYDVKIPPAHHSVPSVIASEAWQSDSGAPRCHPELDSGSSKEWIPDRVRNDNFTTQSDLESLRFDSALAQIWDNLRQGNVVIDKEKPWELAKTNRDKLIKVLSSEYDRLSRAGEALAPFMPKTAKEIHRQLTYLDPQPLFPKSK